MNLKNLLLIISLFLSITSIQAQSVGLVLSGGGAKGFAHIGTIRALEENEIPIDYIAGTSMGAIIGALYSIGYSPDEMEQLINSKDFIKWSYGIIDKDEEYYYKLKNEMPDWLEFPFKKEGNHLKPELPTSVITPFQMDLRFLEFFSPASAAAQYDYNKLMVPFFCVATDVYKGEPYIMHSGDLAASVRASMTFPGYFNPISIDSTLLFDGGMENNFPTDIMIESFNPDVLIGCKVASNPKKPDSDDLYRQLENVFMKKTNYQMPENGILIEPDVKQYNLMDFENFDTIAIHGYIATLEKIDSIKLMIPRTKSLQELNEERKIFKARQKELMFQNIYITGVENQTVEYILQSIKQNRELLTFKQVEEEYFKLLSDKIIKSIYPRAVYNTATGYFDLYLEIKTKKEFSILVGGNISSNVRNMGYVALDYVYLKKNIYELEANTMLGKFYNSVSGKFQMDFPPRKVKNERVITPFYIDLSATIQNYDYFSITTNWFADSESQTKVLQRDNSFQTNIGRPISNRSLLYAGFSYGLSTDSYFHDNLVEQDDVPDKTEMDYSSIHLTYEYSTLNRKQYPDKGFIIKARGRYITASEIYTAGSTAPEGTSNSTAGHSWYNIKAHFEKYYKTTNWFTLGINSELNLSNKKTLSNSIATMLDAPVYRPFAQSYTIVLEKYRANTYLGAGLVPIIHFTDRLELRGEAYIFQPYQYIETSEFETTYSTSFPVPRLTTSLAAIYHTPIGPIAMTASYFMDEAIDFYFQVNFGYLLFNPKGRD